MIEFIKQWIDDNHLNITWVQDNLFTVDGKSYLCLFHKDGKIIDEEFKLIVDESELEGIESLDNFCFAFGGKVYYTPVTEDIVQLNMLKYLGKAKGLSGYPFLGIHGGYELCSGSRKYEDWCKKAKFLSIGILGLTEKHTLAGALKFQSACLKNKIKPIIGETVTIKGAVGDYKVKLYCKDYVGWRNLLRIHKRMNVDNLSAGVEEDFLLTYHYGLFVVFQNDVELTDQLVDAYNANAVESFFQYDPVQYKSEQRDLHCLNCLKNYIKNYRELIPLALITDAYYLDQEDHGVRKILNFIGGAFHYQSDDQYMKSLENIAAQSVSLFESAGEDFAFDILASAMDGVNKIATECNFQIKTGEIHLPKYELSEEERKHFTNIEDLFWDIINRGVENKIVKKGKDLDMYLKRIEMEAKVILDAGLEDYFLTLYDLVQWCKRNNILTGIGRGSAAGSLISYCMSITEVDPLEYDLLFERFVNSGRLPKAIIENGVKKLVGGSLADVDLDVLSDRRNDVKKYMEERWGVHNVCSIGTYSALKTKAAFRELLRFYGQEPKNINYFAGMIDESGDDYTTLFIEASANNKLKQFINDNLAATQDVPLILSQPKSSSIHASGIVITPTIDGTMQIYDWFPCKVMDGALVSEFEGTQIDETGFLKVDVLGLNQLDKFAYILKLIEENRGKRIDLDDLDLNDDGVYELFKKGYNQDVFQFSGDGLSGYCREFKPENIEDLTLINAIYRPGPMGSGTHNDAVKVKFGKKELKYDFGTEQITKDTYGYTIFQEQVMQVCVHVGGFTLLEADDIRKAMGKKLEEKIKPYREQFVAGAIKNGCQKHEAIQIWGKLELFAGYGFNKSHSVSYAITGYRCQWLKKHFPLEFWTTSLQMAKDDKVSGIVSEARKFEDINLCPPDINKSRATFYTDWETNSIYWSLGRIKQVGDVSLSAIIDERTKNGLFFSLEEFVARLKSKSVNSRVVKYLIFSGCFDEIYKIDSPLSRKKIIDEFCKLYSVGEPEEIAGDLAYNEFNWYKLQRNLSGFGYFDYSTLVDDFMFAKRDFVVPEQVQMVENVNLEVVVAGILVDFVKRKTKKGEMGKLTIDHNNDLIDIVLWNDQWEPVRKEIESGVGMGIMLNGEIRYDAYNKKNVVYGFDRSIVNLF